MKTMMKVGFAAVSGCFTPLLLQTGFTFPVGGHPILRQQRLQCQGAAKTSTSVFGTLSNDTVGPRSEIWHRDLVNVVKVMLCI